MTPVEARIALAGLSDRPRRDGFVRLTTDGPVAMLTIDNPGAANALTLGMMDDLGAAVVSLREFDGSCLILASTPPAFCAGGHLDDVQASLTTPEAGATMCGAMTAILDGLLDLPLVSVCAIDGTAIGGGAELVTACDHRVGTARARVQFVQARLGVAAGWGGAGRLVRLLGRSRALRLLSTGEAVAADAAFDLGLLDQLVPADATAAARAFLAPVLANPVAAVRAVKAQVTGSDPVAAFASVWAGPAHRAALASRR
jgi:enoyl-CoA hydratase/carnithine racemase